MKLHLNITFSTQEEEDWEDRETKNKNFEWQK